MKIGWGWKIMILYGAFVLMIITLVTASSKQRVDLVSKDYYQEEITYQKVLDAGKNQAALSASFGIHANGSDLVIEFPQEFQSAVPKGVVTFYSPVNETWDRSFDITAAGNKFVIPLGKLYMTRYIVKIRCTAGGKDYYQESEIQLHK